MNAQRPGGRATCTPVRLVAMFMLSGCATLGGNVKGSFSCQAPSGVCAPSSTIDDRALAMISGDAGDTVIAADPRGTSALQSRTMRTNAPSPPLMAGRTAAAAPRPREKVLRILFQPYIDDQGRLHEASAVHVVVQPEGQAQDLAEATPIPDDMPARTPSTEATLVDAVERGVQETVDVVAFDPNLPDPDVVAAARARARHPVETMKADVPGRLNANGQRRRMVRPATPAGTQTLPVAPLLRTPTKNVPSSVGGTQAAAKPTVVTGPLDGVVHHGATPQVAAGQQTTHSSTSKTASGPEAVARVTAGDINRDARGDVAAAARDAGAAAPTSSLEAVASPTDRATGFPASVPEDR